MKILLTGAAGHLGEGLARTLGREHEIVGVDILPSPFTSAVGSIADRAFVRAHMAGVDAVLNAATLHKPHVATHTRQDFVDVNITGTLNLLEEAVAAGAKAFVFTSTTSVYSGALAPDAEAAAWIDEDVRPAPKNIYGVTKLAAEEMCGLFHRKFALPCVVLRTSRFFPEEDDSREAREAFDDANLKANEFLYRRVDLADAVSAHVCALERARDIGFARYVISATTPFTRADVRDLRADAPGVLRRRVPDYEREYARRGWNPPQCLDRVYDNSRARAELGWRPEYNFARVVTDLAADKPLGSDLARLVDSKGYHAEDFADGPYPVDS